MVFVLVEQGKANEREKKMAFSFTLSVYLSHFTSNSTSKGSYCLIAENRRSQLKKLSIASSRWQVPFSSVTLLDRDYQRLEDLVTLLNPDLYYPLLCVRCAACISMHNTQDCNSLTLSREASTDPSDETEFRLKFKYSFKGKEKHKTRQTQTHLAIWCPSLSLSLSLSVSRT